MKSTFHASPQVSKLVNLSCGPIYDLFTIAEPRFSSGSPCPGEAISPDASNFRLLVFFRLRRYEGQALIIDSPPHLLYSVH